MQCPVDHEHLDRVLYEGVAIWTCPRCAGELIPGDALAHIVHLREQTFDPECRRLIEDAEPIRGVPVTERQRELGCSLCDQTMEVVNYAGDSGVFVDRCPACQTVWLDATELESVQLLMQRWEDDAPARLRAIAGELERRRIEAARNTHDAFQGSRFSFINALINRLLDAA